MSVRTFFGAIYRAARLAGVDPREAIHLKNLPRYYRDLKEFKKQGGKVGSKWIILSDYEAESGSASGHYFHQDLVVAQRIHAANPEMHLDVGSRIDGFVAHLASFREVDVLDIRPLENKAHPQIRFVQADLMKPQPHLVGRYPSVSCLHALEHFGLGRYSDPIDVHGHRRGFDAVGEMVAPQGTLYIGLPIGRRRVEFNAHRVFDPQDPVDWAKEQFSLERFDYVDDRGDLHRDRSPQEAAGQSYACGIYTFVRR